MRRSGQRGVLAPHACRSAEPNAECRFQTNCSEWRGSLSAKSCSLSVYTPPAADLAAAAADQSGASLEAHPSPALLTVAGLTLVLELTGERDVVGAGFCGQRPWNRALAAPEDSRLWHTAPGNHTPARQPRAQPLAAALKDAGAELELSILRAETQAAVRSGSC